ncbi:MAG: Chromosome-partitioning protein Spo0J [Pelotomaculum sp. PtaB.Bin104]|nr:MAG: Chromosome-partitioning protein Spo0J [Pelotomaculum sp. PtaB.Bin104]
MPNEISVNLLKPHPKNTDYYSDLEPEKYEEIKRSIKAHGIRDPLKVKPDYTILAGHQRYRIALELGLQEVPITVMDVSDEEAEYLMIADNEERRQSDNDPMKKARRAAFLKKYWGVKQGPKFPQNEENKTAKDIADAVGINTKNLNRLLKLNDLIPEIQALVSSGELGTTAAHELAHLSPETQKSLLESYGKKITEIKAAEAKELRRQIEEEIKTKNNTVLEKQLSEKEEALREVSRELEEVRQALADMEEDNKKGHEIVNKLLDELNEKDSVIEELNNDTRRQNLLEDIAKLEKEKNHLVMEIEYLNQQAGEAKQKKSLADPVVNLANRTLNPLLEFKGKLEIMLNEIEEDPYNSINMCFTRHLRVLESIRDVMRQAQERFAKRKAEKKEKADEIAL